ncbi:threonyl tRNA synthetase, partial [mine drainage metagenome]
EDFPRIEAEMEKIVAENRPFTRYELPRDAAVSKLEKEGNPYKLDNAQRALAADPQAVISFYTTGEPQQNWEDLCRGPHLARNGPQSALV